jgi:sugar/nucleoside kinase (ribokinase family)
MPKIHVVGNAIFDVLVTGYEKVEPGQITFVNEIETVFGGNGLNVALTAAHMGAPVHLYTTIGKGDEADKITKECHDKKIELHNIDVEAPTPKVVVLVDKKTKDRSFLSPTYTQFDIPLKKLRVKLEAHVEENDIVFFTGLGNMQTLLDRDFAALLKALKKKKSGLKIAVDLIAVKGWGPEDWESQFPALKEMHWVLPSEAEVNQFFGFKGEARRPDEVRTKMNKLKSEFPKASILVIKRGKKGAAIYIDSGNDPPLKDIHAAQVLNRHIVDMTGAGDVWCGTFLAEIIKGTGLIEEAILAGRTGCAAASHCIRHSGANTWRNEVTPEAVRDLAETIEVIPIP